LSEPYAVMEDIQRSHATSYSHRIKYFFVLSGPYAVGVNQTPVIKEKKFFKTSMLINI